MSPVLITGRLVDVGKGTLVLVGGIEMTVWEGGSAEGVDGLRRLDAIRATPPNPKRAQAATRQPTIQTVGMPDRDVVLVLAVGETGGTVTILATCSLVSRARFQAVTNSA